MKLKLVKILAWTGLLGLFAAGGSYGFCGCDGADYYMAYDR